MRKFLYLIICTILLSHQLCAQKLTLKGKVTDAANQKPVQGVSVTVKNSLVGVVTNASGQFELNVSLPATLSFSAVGYETKEVEAAQASEMNVALAPVAEMLSQVVVSASRVEENILRSPVTIEKMDARAIQQTPSANFYDALNNLKGLDMVTSSISYKQINTRGFNTTGNSRFLQLVDGVDNQSAGLGFAMGNLFGPHDLDVESVELIPGSSSALYGPIAFNGMLQMQTKNPFKYQGLSVQTKLGVNHVGDEGGAKPYYDVAVRYAKAISDKFAFKLNASYMKGTDWYANNYTDIDQSTPPANRGDNNPARNAVNIYGDEVATTLPGTGRVSRTGYEEKYVAAYGVYNAKINGALHYRFSEKLELIYQLNYNQGIAQYTGSSRFVINNFKLIQNRIELKGSHFYIRAYSNQENSEDSYNSRSLAQLINRYWVKDLTGTVVSPAQADATWFTRYGAAYSGNISGVSAGNHTAARSFADEGRLIPGTPAFEALKDQLIKTQGLQGAGIYSKCGLRHIEGVYDFSSLIHDVINLQVGGNYRRYILNTQGTLFDDKDKNLTNDEYGAFVQASKSLAEDKLKLTVSARYDKNENFEGRFTPRASMVYSPLKNHFFRASYQTGFRNPTIGDQYIKLNVGPIIILGGAPVNSEGTGAYKNSYTAASVGAFGQAAGAALGQGASFPDAINNNISKLQQSDVPYIKPEQVKSFEIGYKGVFDNRFVVDINYFYSRYRDFIINTVVISPQSPILLPDGSMNPVAAGELLTGRGQAYQLYTNATDIVSIQGVSAGASYRFDHGYSLNGNLTWSDFNLMDANPSNIPAFNTPTWKTNLVFGNAKLTERVGFNVAWHWQSAFDWYGTFTGLVPGRINAYSLLDAQVSYSIPAWKTMVKLGASNLTNQYVVQAYGSPAVGGLYYISVNFDELFK